MLSPSEGAYGRHVKGSASPHDLEATFQLLHLLFTQPPKLEAGEMDAVMVQVCSCPHLGDVWSIAFAQLLHAAF